MELMQEKKGKATIFTLSGRLDTNSAPAIEEQIVDSIKQGNHYIILDCEKLEYISSAGVRALVHLYRRLDKLHGHLFLSGVRQSVENILQITGFLPFFNLVDSVDQALRSVSKKSN